MCSWLLMFFSFFEEIIFDDQRSSDECIFFLLIDINIFYLFIFKLYRNFLYNNNIIAYIFCSNILILCI